MNGIAKTRPEKTSPAKIRVLIADDHVMVLEGLAAIIGRQADMEVVAEAGDGRAAVALWEKHRPDVALLDLRMPELDGGAATEQIRQQDSSARVIVLTTYDTENEIVRVVRAGARGYLLKDTPREELLDCVRRVSRGEMCIPAPLAAKLVITVTNESLTGREVNVLELLGKGRSNKELGASLCISETTVKSHLRSIFAKLNVLSRTEAITVASRRGLIRL